MAAQSHLHAVHEPRPNTERLVRVIDELRKAYPQIEDQVGVRSSDGAGGNSGALAVPVNLEALTFVNEYYWANGDLPADDHTSSPPCAAWRPGSTGQRCGHCEGCRESAAVASCTYRGCGADPDNWRAGIKLTVLSLEGSARRALGFNHLQRARPKDYGGHGKDLRIIDALDWLQKSAQTLAETNWQLADTIREEFVRLVSRCKGMIAGRGVVIDAEWSRCQHCGQDTVCSDQESRAVCTNSDCRREDGLRHCWQVDETTGAWVEVEEPDRHLRGRNLTDDQLKKRVYGI